jgi:hypothetical protein
MRYCYCPPLLSQVATLLKTLTSQGLNDAWGLGDGGELVIVQVCDDGC